MHSVFSGSQRRVPDITTHQETCWESVCVLLEQAAREIRCNHKNNGLWKSASGLANFTSSRAGFCQLLSLELAGSRGQVVFLVRAGARFYSSVN